MPHHVSIPLPISLTLQIQKFIKFGASNHVRVLDHLVVGEDTVSLVERGLI